MEAPVCPLTCYLALRRCPLAIPDPAADDRMVSAIVSFAIPDYGILYRTRMTGDILDLEFRALFAVLGFIQNRLAGEKIEAVRILSSTPEFIFALTPESPHLLSNRKRRNLLRKFCGAIKVTAAYVRQADNRALLSPADLPAMPRGAEIAFSEEPERRSESGSLPPFGVDI